MDRVDELIQKSKLLVAKYKSLLERNRDNEAKIKELEEEVIKYKKLLAEKGDLEAQINQLNKERNEIREKIEEIVKEIDQLSL